VGRGVCGYSPPHSREKKG
jgi:hypothetical protein